MNWNAICKPKFMGGLSIKKTIEMNKAILAKTSWRMLQRDKGLWCHLFKKKYLKSSSLLCESYKKPLTCSSTWFNICFGTSLLRQGLVWRIGNGEEVQFWTDLWFGRGLLFDKALDPSIVNAEMLVQDFWSNGKWDVVPLYACLPPDIVERILCIPFFNCHKKDQLICKHTPNGVFSIKSAYLSIIEPSPIPSIKWKLIWSLQIHPPTHPPKVENFYLVFLSK